MWISNIRISNTVNFSAWFCVLSFSYLCYSYLALLRVFYCYCCCSLASFLYILFVFTLVASCCFQLKQDTTLCDDSPNNFASFPAFCCCCCLRHTNRRHENGTSTSRNGQDQFELQEQFVFGSGSESVALQFAARVYRLFGSCRRGARLHPSQVHQIERSRETVRRLPRRALHSHAQVHYPTADRVQPHIGYNQASVCLVVVGDDFILFYFKCTF